MDRKTIITKTGKGMREALGTIRTLPRDLHDLLSRIDGRSSIEDLANQHAGPTAVEVETHLARLAAEGYIREVSVSDGDREGADLDFTSQAWLKAAIQAEQVRRDEEQARLKAEATARRWAEMRTERRNAAKAKREAEERVKREAAQRARQEAEDKARREAEERARRQAAERARREAEDRARREAEERARREEAERVQREAAERARREAEERARLEAAERARREAEDRARREAEERARREEAERVQREAEERAKREAEERARLEAAERARREAEDRARREAEERARREEAERVQREAEERAKREAEERARLEAAERARREAEDRARREAEERARREAAERAQREAEERAKRKAEERAQREAAKRAKREARNHAKREAKELAQRKAVERARHKTEDKARTPVYRRRPLKPGRLAAWALACLVLCLILVHAVPFDWRIPSLERTAAAELGQPVKISSVHLSLVARPHWRLNGVVIGDQRQIQIPAVRMMAGVGSLFGDHPVFTGVELDAPRVNAESMAWLLFGKPDGRGLAHIHVDARNVVLDGGSLSLPNFDVSTDVGTDGRWRTIVANSTDRTIAIELHADGSKVHVSAGGKSLALPFLAAPQLADWRVTGSATRSGLELTTFEGRLLGGRLDGKASMTWHAAMRIDGTLQATRIEAAQLYPGLFAAGLLDATAAFSLPLQQPDKQTGEPRLAGQFSIQQGTLGSVNLGNVLKDLGTGGTTRFAKLDGSFVHAGSRTQLRDLQLDAGAMSASGYADVDADQKIQGAATIMLALPGERRRTRVDLAGTFSPPYGRNLRWLRN